MAGNSNGANRRLEFLEKAFLEDRERWRALGSYIRKSEARIEAILRRIERLEERADGTWKLLHRHLEAGD